MKLTVVGYCWQESHGCRSQPNPKRKKAIVTTLIVDVGGLITSSTEIRNGQPLIAGTGVTVQRIVRWYRLGLGPEEIADRIGHLSLAQVHAALAYYHANRHQLEAAIQQEDREADDLEQAYLSSLSGHSDR